MSSDISAAAYRRTPEGEQELAEPKHGLSISQRRTLQVVDGQSDTASLAARVTGNADEQQLLRDIERLEKLGLVSGGTRGAGSAGATPVPQTRRKSRAVPALMGLALLLAGGGAVYMTTREAPPAPAAAANPQAAAAGEVVAQAEVPPVQDDKVFGVMPNPARWFSPAAKTETPPEEAAPARAKAEAAKPVAQPPAAKAATAAPAPVVALPAASNPPPAAPATVPAPKPAEPVQVATPAPVPAPATAQPAPTAAVVAKVEPDRRPIYREQPDFPREAARAGVESGTVKARMTVNTKGQVTQVEILEAKPRRVFDRAVSTALSKWKFREAGSSFTVETQIEFKES